MKLTITADIMDDPGLAKYLDRCLTCADKRTILKAAVYTTLQDMISYYDGAYRHLDIQLQLDEQHRGMAS
jgi:hypothetical protein